MYLNRNLLGTNKSVHPRSHGSQGLDGGLVGLDVLVLIDIIDPKVARILLSKIGFNFRVYYV